ncbi:MAG TPA: type II toxin-antitoxin system VapC family toxin [Candidatus Brocadiia bacterium]|nr:type II toxin-antitoxin system VapC family toxin [Candidatus Brocadiia bacterium]
MIFDTDVLIWIERGNRRAARVVESAPKRFLSIFSRMELMQGARNRRHQDAIRDFLARFDFILLPLTENIGHRALIYVEQYGLTHGLTATDAVIAATAAENDLTLVSSNAKHYRLIKDLRFKAFAP